MRIQNTIMLMAFGAVLGALGMFLMSETRDTHDVDNTEPQPLYWVAPMDPNFKRDQPGKSPMGMDLVPVYETSNDDDSQGQVTISPQMQQNLGIRTVRVEREIPSSTLKTVGTIQYDETAMVHVHPRISGWIEQLYVSAEGDFVTQGSPLYSMYSPELVNAQEEYLLALQQNNRNLINAAQARLSALRVPQEIIEVVLTKREVQTEITFSAPQTGYVDKLHIREGFYVDPKDTLMALAGNQTVWAVIDVLPHDSGRVTTGQSVVLQAKTGAQERYTGQIEHLYPDVDPITRALRARVQLTNADGELRPDMLVDALIDTHSHLHHVDPVISVPIQAVIQTGGDNRVVLQLDDSRFQSVPVTLGQDYDETVEVVSGLNVGDNIVLSGQFLIDSDSHVETELGRFASVETEAETTPAVTSWTGATVNAVDHQGALVNLTHGPLDAFGMPGMTMNFDVAADVNFHPLEKGMVIHVEIGKNESGQYVIKTLHIPTQENEMHHHHGDHE